MHLMIADKKRKAQLTLRGLNAMNLAATGAS